VTTNLNNEHVTIQIFRISIHPLKLHHHNNLRMKYAHDLSKTEYPKSIIFLHLKLGLIM
jgi:hypothetical protein